MRFSPCSALALLALLVVQSHAWVGPPSTPSRHRTSSLEMTFTRPWRKRRTPPLRKQVRVKSRPVVTYDPTMGTVNTVPQTESSDNKWRSIKSSVYSTFDTVGGLVSKLKREKDAPPPPRRPVSGYNDVIERRVFSPSTVPPGQRLMQEYKERGPTLKVVQPEESFFDSFKESVYSAADSMAAPKQPAQSTPSPLEGVQDFKPYTQPTILASSTIRDSLPQVQSSNPFKRFFAERKIRRWEDAQRKRDEALDREAQIQAMKDTVYAVVDTVQAGAEIAAQTPEKMAETASAAKNAAYSVLDWAKTVPDLAASATDALVSIPKQLQNTASGVQQTVESTAQSTVKTTKNVVDGVVGIPQKVVQTVEGTKQGIGNTVKAVENTVKSVDDTTTRFKVWTGLEKPKPKPPPPKPIKELTVTNLAWDIGAPIVQGTADFVWWFGSNSAKLGFRKAKQSMEDARKKQKEKQKEKEVLTTAAEFVPVPPPEAPPLPQTLAEASSIELEEEVTEALALAQSALREVESETVQLEEAVRRAKAAAIAATKDGVEITEPKKKRE